MRKYTKFVSIIALCVFLTTLIPLLILGWYNHPTGDDYYYGVETKQTWESTHNLILVFRTAVDGVIEQYHIWQGTYSAMFLMYLPPNIFGPNAYRFVTLVILALLITGIFFLTHKIFCGFLGSSVEEWISIASLLSFLCIQTTPFASESYFWFNGSIYYTGYWGISLIYLGLLCIFLRRSSVAACIVSCLLAFFLAGGNYVSLLPTMLISFTMAAFAFLKKAIGKYCFLAPCTCLCIGFLFSALAPGNQVRQSGMWKIPAVLAIFKSVRQGFIFLGKWSDLWLLFALLILAPVFWGIYQRSSFSFPCPLLVIGYSFGIMCSTACPTYYTMNSTGPARAAALMFYTFLFFIFLSYFYLLGYLHRVWNEKKPHQLRLFFEHGKKPFLLTLPVILLLVVLFGNTSTHNYVRACITLLNGNAASYEEQYRARLSTLSDTTVKDVVFAPYESPADLLYVGDITSDPTDPTNQRIAAYFDKNSICVNYD